MDFQDLLNRALGAAWDAAWIGGPTVLVVALVVWFIRALPRNEGKPVLSGAIGQAAKFVPAIVGAVSFAAPGLFKPAFLPIVTVLVLVAFLALLGLLLLFLFRLLAVRDHQLRKTKRVFRWVVMLPVALLAGVATALLVGSLLGPEEPNYLQTSALLASCANMALATTVTLFVARSVAPTHKLWVVAVLATVLVVLNLGELGSALTAMAVPAPQPKERIRVAEALGFLVAASTFLGLAVKGLRKRTAAA